MICTNPLSLQLKTDDFVKLDMHTSYISISNYIKTVTKTSMTVTKTCRFPFQLTSTENATNNQKWQKKANISYN